ncbi:C1 family peptidase [Liquorilactobacillus satsumensis]|uniref:C1 family peptidase n=1 Tax=Liquorilactobacillus satsumensis TaxID=259059 RepID=UPI0021C4256B|nr:C1 family peptidase [Liquorilactobacillus satsumensis]MCP9313392.1 C1 family peptidase [Liquorilactobacillus satsumensis]MCP9360088.1 C1 family peptidase [Liquorilactobacillus satsumensis]
MKKDITQANLERFRTALKGRKVNAVVARAVQQNGVNAASENIAAKQDLTRIFSIELPTGKVTNQKKSGRCWLFSTLNTLRHQFAEQYQIKDFQFSQNYNSFYDRLEKANHFYEEVLATAAQPLASRIVQHLFAGPDDDGGQWANAAALIEKYGVVPQDVMPETYNSEKTAEINDVLSLKLRKDGLKLRELVNAQAAQQEIVAAKEQFLEEVYRMLVYAFGEPPTVFDFEYRDDEHKYHLDQALTPQRFFAKYVAWDFNDYVCLTNAPDHELGQVYSLPSQDYIFNGQKIAFVNTELAVLKEAAIAQLKAGQSVWFGNDVTKDLERTQGILAPAFHERSALFDVGLQLTKAQRLQTGEAHVSHAMTLVGVDVIAGHPTKWKVENSWGEKIGDQGYFVMSAQWFDDYVYEVIVNQKYLKDAQRRLLQQKKIELAPWDSLA